MPKIKLLRKAINNPGGLRFSEAQSLAESFGFKLDRISGSHHIYIKAGIPELINLQNVKGKAKSYQIKQLLCLVEQYNITQE